MAQVQVGVDIDDADARRAAGGFQVSGQAEEAAVSHFVAAAEHDGKLTVVQQAGHLPAQFGLGGFQFVVAAMHVAGVVGGLRLMPGQIGQRAADGARRGRRARAALVAAHAGVAGKAQQGDAGGDAGHHGRMR